MNTLNNHNEEKIPLLIEELAFEFIKKNKGSTTKPKLPISSKVIDSSDIKIILESVMDGVLNDNQ